MTTIEEKRNLLDEKRVTGMSDQVGAKRNRLLDELSPDEWICISSSLKPVMLISGQILYNIGSPIRDVYFPTNGLISLLQNLENGVQAEVGLIGQEGMIGQSVLSGIDISYSEAAVQLSGTAFQMSADNFQKCVKANAALRAVVSSYNQSIFVQLMQSAACNAHHSIERRLARLLLTAQDRAGSANLLMTQAVLASMLSVKRPSITLAAITFQESGLIRYSHGRIVILNRSGLEKLACECYNLIRLRGMNKLSRTCL